MLHTPDVAVTSIFDVPCSGDAVVFHGHDHIFWLFEALVSV